MSVLVLFALALAPSAEAATPGVSGQLEQSSKATPKEKAQNAAEMSAEIRAAVDTVSKLLEAARNEKDKDKSREQIKCLEEKLPQLKTIQEIAGKANTEMEASLASGDTTNADKQYRQLAVLHGRAKELLVAAQQCVKGSQGDRGKGSTVLSGGTEAVTVDEPDAAVPDILPPDSPN